jgi:N utilization substance protein B
VGHAVTYIPGLGSRREAREDALAVLYEMEITGDTAAESLARRDIPPDEYAIRIVEGVSSRQAEIDAVVGRHLEQWRIERLTVIDRTLARMAAWELGHAPEVPTGAVLSELVDLATQYSGADAPRFLNGLLAAVAAELRAP